MGATGTLVAQRRKDSRSVGWASIQGGHTPTRKPEDSTFFLLGKAIRILLWGVLAKLQTWIRRHPVYRKKVMKLHRELQPIRVWRRFPGGDRSNSSLLVRRGRKLFTLKFTVTVKKVRSYY